MSKPKRLSSSALPLRRAACSAIEPLEHRVLFASTPFLGSPLAVPGTIQVDNYDIGGEGVAYHDTTAANLTGKYRNDAVDIETTSDVTPPGETAASPGVGFNIGHVRSGEWLNYTVNVAASGTYAIDVRIASSAVGGTFHIEFDGTNATGAMNLINTGGWQTWATVSVTNINLTAGQHVMRLAIDGNLSYDIGNLNYIQIRPTSSTAFSGVPISLPGKIEAENFDLGGEGVAYHDTTSTNLGGQYRSTAVDIETASDDGGGYDIGHIRPTEWLTYTVSVAGTATYAIDARVASSVSGGLFHVEMDGTNITGSMTFPNTGGWQTWATVSSPAVTLTAGQHVMRLAFDGNATYDIGNVNWLSVRTASTTGPVTWSNITDSPIARDEGQVIAVGKNLYAFGGFDDPAFDSATRSDVYDTTTNTWTRLADMPEAISHAGTVYDSATNTIWMLGGFVGPENAPAINHVWKYSITSNTWTAGPAMPSGTGAEAVVLVGRTIHVISGLTRNSSNAFVNTNEHWTMSLDNPGVWSNAAAMPTPRNHAGFVTLNGLIYVVGGQDVKNETTGNSAAMEVYNPATDSWTRLASLPQGRSHLMTSTLVYKGKILVIGGETNGVPARTDTLQYDPITNTWVTLTNITLPAARKAPNAAIFDDLLIVFGGQTSNPLANGWSASLAGQ